MGACSFRSPSTLAIVALRHAGAKGTRAQSAVPFVAGSIVFFVAGVAVAYFSFGHAIQNLQAIGGRSLISYYNPVQYLSLILLMMFVFGITFEFPVVLVVLELAGIVTPRQLLHA
jgi:sec-independent protein translocase protein TatC